MPVKRTNLICAGTIMLFLATGILFSRCTCTGAFDGLYLLKGTPGKLFELKDDILLGEYERLIARIEFQAFRERWRSTEKADEGRSYLKYSWSRKNGNGYLISFFPNGTKFLACFGRSIDESSTPVKGLFLGGGLPKSHYEGAELKMNETGVAFFDGKKWHRLWRHTREAIFSPVDATNRKTPGQWEFLGSTVLFASQYRLVLKSSHLASIGQMPVSIDRYLLYRAGDRFFTLVTRLTNSGTAPLGYHYTCGNEPREGSFCGSADNGGGWTREDSRILLPGRAETIFLTIGLADTDPKTALPRKPEASIDPGELRYLLSR